MELKCKNGKELLGYALSFEKVYGVNVQHSTKEFNTYISTQDIIDTFEHYGGNTAAAIKHIDQYIERMHYEAEEQYRKLLGKEVKTKHEYVNKFPNRDYSINRKQRRFNEKNNKK